MKWIGEHRIQGEVRFDSNATLNPGSDTDRFLVQDGNGLVGYRTGAEVLADIGGMASSVNILAFDGSTANGICTYKDADEISVESTLTYDSETLTLGADDDGSVTITRLPHSDDTGGVLRMGAGNATAGQTNKAGGDLQLGAGQPTGSGAGGDVKILTAPAGASGTVLRAYSNTWSFNDDGTLDTPGTINITGDISASGDLISADDVIVGDDITIGPDDTTISNIKRLPHSDGDGGVLSIFGGDATSGQTNKAGGDLLLFGGKSTGNAAGGNVTISTYETGSSGTSLAASSNSWVFSSGESVTLSSPTKCLGIKENVNFANETFETVLSNGDHTSSKALIYGADETLTDGQIYFLHTDGSWDQADASTVATGASQLLGVGNGRTVTKGAILEGFIRVPSTEILNTPGSGAVDGLPVYVSTTAGHFDFTAPSGNNEFVRVVGYAIDDDSSDVLVYFNPDRTWVKVTA